MKKVFFALLLTVILCGLPGCTSSRVAVKTEAEQQTRKTEVTDSSRTEQTKTTDQLTAVLSSNEQQTVVIEFEEWEYYPASEDTTETQGSNPETYMNAGEREEKPPNAGSVKRHKKGTITINGKKETTEQKEQASVTETNIQETGSREATIDESTKEKTSTKKDSRKAYVWIALGLLCAVLLIGAGIYLARRQ